MLATLIFIAVSQKIQQPASLPERYIKAIEGISFEPVTTIGGYCRASVKGKPIHYPAIEPVTTSAIVSYSAFVWNGKPSTLHYSSATVIDPHGKFMFRVTVPFGQSKELIICDPIPGDYILHATSKNAGQAYYTFQIKDGDEISMSISIPER